MARASSTAENNSLTGLVTDCAFLALFTSGNDPSTTGATGEVSGGSYVRQSTTWGSPASGAVVTSNSQTVPVPASTTVAFGGEFGASTGTTGGGYQIGFALSSTITFVSAGNLIVGTGAISLGSS